MDTEKNETKPAKKGRNFDDDDNGFGDWGGYKAAKRSKLMKQFKDSEIPRLSNIFEGVAIHVNGLTRPPSDQLKKLMAAHGGLFHMYQVPSTTHIIASNLPNVKIKHIGTVPVVRPSWITDSVDYGKLLDFSRYLLYTNQSKTQPKIEFPCIQKSTSTNTTEENSLQILAESSSSSELVRNEQSNSLNSKNRLPTKTASDPNFLEEFYNNSRLHLISTLGAEFKHLVGQMRDKSDGKFIGMEKLIALRGSQSLGNNNPNFISNSVIMHIDMDCFFVSVSLRNHPELKDKPVAITHARNGQLNNVKPDQVANRAQEFSLYSERLPIGVTSRVDKIDVQSSLSEIASCSYEARKSGIRNGMFLGQAVKMCPELKTLPYDFQGIKEVSHKLYEIIASYTLDIEAVSCDEMYVDITKILRETGMTVEEWATYIRNEIINDTGCPCSTGFGANRLQARLATKKAKPAGQYYLKPESVESYMVEVALADLPGVGRATLAKLQKMGLNTCGDVQLASLKNLQSEIGQKAGETLKEQSMGVDNKPLNYHHERKSISADVNYGIRFKTLEECYNFLENLSVEVFNRMNDINMRARCLTIKLLVRAPEAPKETAKFLGHGICDSITKSTTSNTVLNNPQIIFKEAKALYEKLNPLFSDLRGVGLQLTKLEKNAAHNNALSNFLKQSNTKETKNSNEINNKTTDLEQNKVIIQRKKSETDVKKENTIMKKEVTKTTNVSRRGRPKGATTSTKKNKSVKKVESINKYFVKTKSMENKPKSNQNSSGYQNIDMTVLNELPENIRKEIMKEYNIQEKSIIKNTIKKCDSQKTEPKTSQPSQSSNNCSPFSNLNWDQIKPIIKKWTESDSVPIDFDTEMIAEHFKQLAIRREIEVLTRIFNYLYRTFSNLNCNWHKAYFQIVNITQEGMVARYGKTLFVQRNFKCCKI